MIYVDMVTGTSGQADDLVLLDVKPPDDFADWSDSTRKFWVESQAIAGAEVSGF